MNILIMNVGIKMLYQILNYREQFNKILQLKTALKSKIAKDIICPDN